MKKLLLLILMILVLAALASGCTPTGSSQESSQSISSTEADLIRDRYIDPSELTAPSQEPDRVCTAEDRTLILEDTPEKMARFNKEIATLEGHWPDIFKKPDPYYNPNLTLKSQDFSLKRL